MPERAASPTAAAVPTGPGALAGSVHFASPRHLARDLLPESPGGAAGVPSPEHAPSSRPGPSRSSHETTRSALVTRSRHGSGEGTPAAPPGDSKADTRKLRHYPLARERPSPAKLC